MYEEKKCEDVEIPIVNSKRVNINRCLMTKARFEGPMCKNMESFKDHKVWFVVPTTNLGVQCCVESVSQ